MDVLITAFAVQLANLALFVWFQRSALVRILALRHQITIYKRKNAKPMIKDRDRLLWSFLSRWWSGWKSELTIVTPATVLRWQKRRLRDYLRRRCQRRGPGRPRIPWKHIHFIKRISRDHPEYSAERIALELKIKFGVIHADSTVDRYRVKPKGDPGDSLRWRTFLKNNADAIWCCDYFVQFTVGFRALHVFVIMHLETRKVIHFGITEHPTLEWTKQQIRNAVFDNEVPKYLIHDNDGRFGQFKEPTQVANESREGETYSCRSAFAAWLWMTLDVRGVPIPPRAPNANAHCERLIGTTRRECLDHLLVWNERHLHQLLSEFYRWYNAGRVHQGIQGIPDPDPALAEPRPALGDAKIVAHPVLGGLHHDYRLAA